MMTRALRRHHAERRKAIAADRIVARNQDPTPKWIGRYATTPHPCSSWCCGNRRRFEGETRAERAAEMTTTETSAH